MYQTSKPTYLPYVRTFRTKLTRLGPRSRSLVVNRLARSMSSPRTSRSAAGKAVAENGRDRSKEHACMTQVSLAQLLGVSRSEASNVNLRLSMSSAAASSSSAPADAQTTDEVPLATHERPRATKRKLPEGPRGRAKSVRTTLESKNVKADARLVQFPDQGLKLSAGVLFCQPCKTTLPNIRNSISMHLATNKHKSNLLKHINRGAADMLARAELTEYFDSHPDERMASLTSLQLHTQTTSQNPMHAVRSLL